MKVGTRSLLFGIHQFIWHPIVVLRAWAYLYGRPTFKEIICIIIHDWGYWGKPNLDGPEGVGHPKVGADIANKLFKDNGYWWNLCAGHSRSYCNLVNNRWGLNRLAPSKLCWADKLSFCFEPRWFYIMRAKISGEWSLVYEESMRHHLMDNIHITPKEWHKKMWFYCYEQREIRSILDSRSWVMSDKQELTYRWK